MYDHKIIEAKWQKIWQQTKLYQTGADPAKPKYYVLDMFPYPSGVGLHVGHPKGYIATDILARLKIMQGYNVLHPMGWDAFGLPAENYAIKNKVHPKIATAHNVKIFKKQLEILGFTYDWEREINTTDPSYYKWTQWAFLQMFKRGLVYESNEPINWCPSCKTGLANEDLEDGACERCGSQVEQRPLRQWVIKITAYAERLLNDLEKLPEWEESIKEMQRNWIGKSEGAEIDFQVVFSSVIPTEVEESLSNDTKGSLDSLRSLGMTKKGPYTNKVIKVFTTRVDTIFGCTYVVLAPENKLLDELKEQIQNWPEILAYRETVKNKTNLERTDLNKDKTGVKIAGLRAINPFNNESLEIFVADYVLNSYGTGAVMAVPAHDERDFAFAEKYKIKTRPSIKSETAVETWCFTADGILINSGEFTGLTSAAARQKMTDWLVDKKLGAQKINYKIKDWVFSRQRYWGEPIPLIHCPVCGVVEVPEAELPLTLPEVKSYEPTGTGESPLANISEWVNTACPKCGGPARRETNTMPQWAGSSWYYLRYIDPQNDLDLVDDQKEKYWSPVDFYVGGAEHATRHLIYARFWHKFLFDIGVVNYDEPFKKFQYVGLIMGEDGQKMSKRWGNVINPDEIVVKYGADTLRIYEMFMGPFSQAAAWNTNGLSGARKFLERIAAIKVSNRESSRELKCLLHKTIKKVEADINEFKFNTAVSALMILVNEIYSQSESSAAELNKSDYKLFLQILAPLAPHLIEELWSNLGETSSVFKSTWPKYDETLVKDEKVELVIQINGKLRATITAPADISEADAKKLALENEIIEKWLVGKEVVKVIFVKGKLINIVIK